MPMLENSPLVRPSEDGILVLVLKRIAGDRTTSSLLLRDSWDIFVSHGLFIAIFFKTGEAISAREYEY